jgi:hypothetical protein
MKLWQRALVLNIAFLLGIGSSVFVVPENMLFRTWLIISILMLVALNIALFGRFKKNELGARLKTSKGASIIAVLCVAYWIIQVVVHIIRR